MATLPAAHPGQNTTFRSIWDNAISRLEWVSAELLKAFGIGGEPSDVDEIKTLLEDVLEMQKRILSKLDDLLREMQFQHLITRGYKSVERINNVYDDLISLSNVIDGGERAREAARIKAGVLDVNLGTRLNLKMISDVLLGKDSLGQSNPLITLFADRWFPAYTAEQLAEDKPLSTYADKLKSWLHGLFITQYLGLSELANARIADGDFELLKSEIEYTTQQMEAQRALLSEAIPEWTRTLPNSLFDGRWYVVKGLDPQGGRIDDSQVMYGSPSTSTGWYLDRTVQFRDRHKDNGDEEWVFEKTGDDDTFHMRERSRWWYVMLRDGRRFEVGGPQAAKLRLVMGRTKDPAVQPTAKRRDLYVPVIGVVGSGDYLTWTRGGTNVVFAGPLDKAVRIQIVHSGH